MWNISIFIGIIAWTLFFGSLNVFGQDVPETMREVSDIITLTEYFNQYGWIPPSEASELISKEKIIEALIAFQEYADLPITGKLDEATLATLNSQRCGNVDFDDGYDNVSFRKKRFTTLGRTWLSPYQLTYYIQGTTPDLDIDTITMEFSKTFQHWSSVSDVTFTQVDNNNADIIINFNTGDHGDGNPFDGPGNTLAHAFPPGGGRGGDAHFDDAETFTNDRGVNLEQVATHEIGHSLGLGHSSDVNAIMAPFYNYRTNFALGADDKNGIISLYGMNTGNNPAPPVATQPPPLPVTTIIAAVTTPTPPKTLPSYDCNGLFDATTENFDGGFYLFQGENIYTAEGFGIPPKVKRPISIVFEGVPSFVDGAFLWRFSSTQKYLYIFKGELYWRFYNNATKSPGYPRSIANYWGGAPSNIDAVFEWTGNGRIYFIKGNFYYRYNTMSHRIDTGYPRPLSVWRNVQAPVSSVLDYNGITFFFTNQYFQFFSDHSFKASGLVASAYTFLFCRTEGLYMYGITDMPTTYMADDGDSGAGNHLPGLTLVVILSSLLGTWNLL